MHKKAHTKLGEEVKQIKSLLIDFKKIRAKCKTLADSLKVDLPKDALYANTERTTLMKLDLLDLPGLVNLKNSLVKILGELFDQERELLYRKQKQETQDKVQQETREMRIKARKESIEKTRQTNAAVARSESVNQRPPEQAQDSMKSSRASDLRQSRSIEIPLYRRKAQTAEFKMDRISKYIASLKKSMKVSTESAGKKWRVKDYLLNQSTYIKAKTELERYMMREEELERLIAIQVRNKLIQHFKNINKNEESSDHYFIRVEKPKNLFKKVDKNKDKSKGQEREKDSSIEKRMKKEVQEETHKKAEVKLDSETIQKQASKDFEEMKVELGRKNEEYAEIFSKMSEVVEKGSERLSEIRQKRRQAFQQDEDCWDEL